MAEWLTIKVPTETFKAIEAARPVHKDILEMLRDDIIAKYGPHGDVSPSVPPSGGETPKDDMQYAGGECGHD